MKMIIWQSQPKKKDSSRVTGLRLPPERLRVKEGSCSMLTAGSFLIWRGKWKLKRSKERLLRAGLRRSWFLESVTIELISLLFQRKPFKISSIQNLERIHKRIIYLPITLALEPRPLTTTIRTDQRSQRGRLRLMSSSDRSRKRKISKKMMSKRRNPQWALLLLLADS
jgi:hypothetical protein